MPRSPYANLRERLVANSEPEFDGDNACWNWTAKRGQHGTKYGRFTLYVPGLMQRVVLTAHVAMYVLSEIGGLVSVDEFYLAYLELRCSGLEVDHKCVNMRCLFPDHLEAVTKLVNIQRRDDRRKWKEYR